MIECICPKCKKNFIKAPQNIFKDERGDYCGWTCYNHRNDKQPTTAKKVKAVEMLSLSGTLLKVFTSANDAAETTGYSFKKIQLACREQSAYHGYLWRYKNDLS